MKQGLMKWTLSAVTLLTLSGCIDDKYDLSDIDTTSQIKVNNLEIPVNLKEITLDKVLDVDNNDEDAIITTFTQNGETFYAVQKKGEFNADPVHIDNVNAPSARLSQPAVKQIEVPEGFKPGSVKIPVPYIDATFDYDVKDVDQAIKSIQGFGLKNDAKMKVEIYFSSDELAKAGINWELSNLTIQLPEGFQGNCGNYEINNGQVYVPTLSDRNGEKRLLIEVDDLDLSLTYPSTDGLVNENGNININGSLAIAAGEISVTSGSSIPSVIDLKVNFSMSAFSVESFSGEINYEVEAPSISSVDLSSLPDFLTGPGSEITLYNPQLYLSVKNMPGEYGVEAHTGLTIQPLHNGMAQESPITADFSIGKNSSDGYYNLVMAPYPAQHSLNTFSSLQYVEVAGLSKVLYGTNGLPTAIDFNLNNPTVTGKTFKFPLGTDMDFAGKYTFFTPLQFEKGSIIHYVKDENDWFEGDVDKMHIEHFKLSANASTNLPFDLTLIAYPWIKDGDNQYIDYQNPAQQTIPAGATDYEFSLTFPKEIDGLNGIYFDAVILMQEEEALNPDQYVKLENIKAVVDGYYVTKF